MANTKMTNRQYRQSEKGKATIRRYNQSEKGIAVRTRYLQSKKGKSAVRRYEQSEKRKRGWAIAHERRKLLEILVNVDEDDEDTNELKLFGFILAYGYKMWKDGDLDHLLPAVTDK